MARGVVCAHGPYVTERQLLRDFGVRRPETKTESWRLSQANILFVHPVRPGGPGPPTQVGLAIERPASRRSETMPPPT